MLEGLEAQHEDALGGSIRIFPRVRAKNLLNWAGSADQHERNIWIMRYIFKEAKSERMHKQKDGQTRRQEEKQR